MDRSLSVYSVKKFLEGNDADKQHFNEMTSCISRGLQVLRAYIAISSVEWHYDNHLTIEEFIDLFLIIMAARTDIAGKVHTSENVPYYIIQLLRYYDTLKKTKFKKLNVLKNDYILTRSDIFFGIISDFPRKKVKVVKKKKEIVKKSEKKVAEIKKKAETKVENIKKEDTKK